MVGQVGQWIVQQTGGMYMGFLWTVPPVDSYGQSHPSIPMDSPHGTVTVVYGGSGGTVDSHGQSHLSHGTVGCCPTCPMVQ